MSMNKVLSIDITIQVKALANRLANFIFPEPVTPYLENLTIQELFDSFTAAVRTGKDSAFPSLDLVRMYGIEGDLQISFFTRALAKFQQDVNQVFLNHGVFDEVAYGGYLKAKVLKGHLLLSADGVDGTMNFTDLRNDYKYQHHLGTIEVAQSTQIFEPSDS